jgi:hypothetical protein
MLTDTQKNCNHAFNVKRYIGVSCSLCGLAKRDLRIYQQGLDDRRDEKNTVSDIFNTMSFKRLEQIHDDPSETEERRNAATAELARRY